MGVHLWNSIYWLDDNVSHVVIAMTIGASRLYLGLVNSAAFNRPLEKIVSGEKFAISTQIRSLSPPDVFLLDDGENGL